MIRLSIVSIIFFIAISFKGNATPIKKVKMLSQHLFFKKHQAYRETEKKCVSDINGKKWPARKNIYSYRIEIKHVKDHFGMIRYQGVCHIYFKLALR